MALCRGAAACLRKHIPRIDTPQKTGHYQDGAGYGFVLSFIFQLKPLLENCQSWALYWQ